MAEVPARLTPWTTRELLAAYAAAWDVVIGTVPSRAALALLWAQASVETGRGGRPGCFNHNVGNVMALGGYAGDFHVLRGAPECFDAGKVPAGWREISASATSIACAPGKVPALPINGSRFRAYASLVEGCTDKLRVLDRQWGRAIVALQAAQTEADADAYVAGLIGPPRYFSASSSSYAQGLRSLAKECLRAVPDADWPDHRDTLPAPPDSDAPTWPGTPRSRSSQRLQAVREPIADLSETSPATPLRAGEGEHTVPLEEPEL